VYSYTATQLANLVNFLVIAHDDADPPSSCAHRSLSTVASTGFHEQLDCLMQSTINTRRLKKHNSKVLNFLTLPFPFPRYT
jgi:hypothetical protein